MQMTIDGIRVVLINEPKNFGQSDKYNRVNYCEFLSFWFGCFKYTSSVPPEIIHFVYDMNSSSKDVKRQQVNKSETSMKRMRKKWSVQAAAREAEEESEQKLRRRGESEVEMKDFCLQQYNLTRVTYTFETDATL